MATTMHTSSPALASFVATLFTLGACVAGFDELADSYVQGGKRGGLLRTATIDLAVRHSDGLLYLRRCTGALISSRAVMTAGHCLTAADREPYQEIVWTETHVQFPNTTDPNDYEIDPDQVFVHPSSHHYEGNVHTDVFDLAIVGLRAVPLAAGSTPLEISHRSEVPQTFQVDGRMIDDVVGDCHGTSPLATCAYTTLVEHLPTIGDTDYLFAGEPLIDPGDSGGPAYVRTGADVELIGITSFIDRICLPGPEGDASPLCFGQSSHFVRLPSVATWIEETAREIDGGQHRYFAPAFDRSARLHLGDGFNYGEHPVRVVLPSINEELTTTFDRFIEIGAEAIGARYDFGTTTAIVETGDPLSVFVERRPAGDPDTDDSLATTMHRGVPQQHGTWRLCFPSVFELQGSGPSHQLRSRIVIANAGWDPALVSVRWADRSGSAVHEEIRSLLPQESASFDSKTIGLPDGFSGSAIAEVIRPVRAGIVGAAIVDYRSREAAYNAIRCSDTDRGLELAPTDIEAPTHYRVYSDPVGSGLREWRLWSAINLQNLYDSPTDVRIDFVPRAGQGRPASIGPITLPPLATYALNTRASVDELPELNHPAPCDPDEIDRVCYAWSGSVRIHSDRRMGANVTTQWSRGWGINARGWWVPLRDGSYYQVQRPQIGRYDVPIQHEEIYAGRLARWSAIVVHNPNPVDAEVLILFPGAVQTSLTAVIPAFRSEGFNTRALEASGQLRLGDYRGIARVSSLTTDDYGLKLPLSVVVNRIDRRQVEDATAYPDGGTATSSVEAFTTPPGL